MSARGVVIAALCALIVSFAQSPGRISADTKLDLTANPLGFLGRATHLWSPEAPMGQVQNQAYGYFFPHGAFFAAGDLAHIPPWITQRLWWAVLLTVGFVGIVRLAEALRAGSPASRIVAATVFVLSPRVLTTLGSISSETLPMMLAPWVLIPVIRALDRGDEPLWRQGFLSAAAVALMGAVNAVATVAALGVALLWWLLTVRRAGMRAVWFALWWVLGLVLACAWWILPLLMMSQVSPPFLDFIESSRTTTQWSSLTEVLRGTSAWTPFVSPERVAGAVLVTQPAAVLATGVLVAAGLAGLTMRAMPGRGRLVTILLTGLLVMCVGYAGALGSPIAESVREFLDGAGAPLRNIHKFEPFVRIPVVLGIAHLLARVPLSDPRAFLRPTMSRGSAAALALAVAVVGSGSLMWTGQLAPVGTYRSMPSYWTQAADWLEQHSAPPGRPALRSLVVPGAPFADQLWGLTRDEPLQALSDTPWAVRDAIPLVPPGAIRAMDSVQRQIASGRGSPGLAATLAGQGIGFVVLRADLNPDTSRSARPLVAQQALDDSPGLSVAARFGPLVGPATVEGVVRDNGLRPALPAITVYAVADAARSGGTGPVLVDAASVPRVSGGPEALAALNAQRVRAGLPALGPAVLDADAQRFDAEHPREPLPSAPRIITDTPTDREIDFGRVDDHSSAIRTADDPRRTQNASADYPAWDGIDADDLVRAQWLLDNRPGQVRVSSSGSAADATQPGQTSPTNSTAAAFDGKPGTAWVSGGLAAAAGKWLRLSFTRPRTGLSLTLTTARAIGPDVDTVVVTTNTGSSVAQGISPGKPFTVTLPGGSTSWIEIRASHTATGKAGNQFAIAEVALTDLSTGTPLSIRQRVTLPELRKGPDVAQWVLTQELTGRSACVRDTSSSDELFRCASGLSLPPETRGVFTRALSVPSDTAVSPAVTLMPTPGDGLRALLHEPGSVVADGPSDVTDPRGTAQAAVDGDPATVWTAPEDGARDDDDDTGDARGGDKKDGNKKEDDDDDDDDAESGREPAGNPAGDEKTLNTGGYGDAGTKTESRDRDGADKDSVRERASGPTLTIRLPRVQRVDRLRIVAPSTYPAAPTDVSVNLGTRWITRKVAGDGTVTLPGTRTDRVRLRVDKSADLIDVNALGFAKKAPAGIADVQISPDPDARPFDPDRVITVGCGDGIGITVAGRVIGLGLRTTAGALRNGEAVTARPCHSTPIPLTAGEQELSVNPGSAFSVLDVNLSTAQQIPSTSSVLPPVEKWSATHRVVEVQASAADRILTVAESTNSGWRATIETSSGTTTLHQITVNGWQQGWVVPKNLSGPVTLRYGLDTPYRWVLVVGLLLMALLLASAWLPPVLARSKWSRHDDGVTGPFETLAPSSLQPQGSRGVVTSLHRSRGVVTSLHRSRGVVTSPQGSRGVAAGPQGSRGVVTWSRESRGVVAASTAAIAVLGTVWLLTGWWGLGIGCATAILTYRRGPSARVVAVFATMLAATVALASGPWHSPTGYHGDDWWTQLPALVAVTILVWSALFSVRTAGDRT